MKEGMLAALLLAVGVSKVWAIDVPASAAQRKVALRRSNPALRQEEDSFLDFLRGTSTSTSAEEPPVTTFEEFLPNCLGHSHRVIRIARNSDSKKPLQELLQEECEHSQEFPSRAEQGAAKEAACRKFSKALAEAHEEEMVTGSQDGYVEFCRSYYEYRGGKEPPPQETEGKGDVASASEPAQETTTMAPVKKGHVSVVFAMITIVVCVAFVLATYLILRRTA